MGEEERETCYNCRHGRICRIFYGVGLAITHDDLKWTAEFLEALYGCIKDACARYEEYSDL